MTFCCMFRKMKKKKHVSICFINSHALFFTYFYALFYCLITLCKNDIIYFFFPKKTEMDLSGEIS